MKIERIDHLNLTVADIDRSLEFYKRVLGMQAESIGEGRAALYFRQQKIHENPATFLCHVSVSSVKCSRYRFASSR